MSWDEKKGSERGSRLPMFRDAVPERLRFPLLLLLPFVYQSSNPLYMNLAASVAGGTGLRETDVIMCGFACILGITVTFPLLFRLKFRFTTRQIVLVCSSAIVLLTLAAVQVRWLPLLVAVCFLFGIFKVWGTFECMSSMMAVISPNMHLAPFLSVVFMAVFGGVELGGWAATWVDHFYGWRCVSFALVAVHLLVLLFALVLLRDFRFQPSVPLRGVDWGGMALWSLLLLSLTALFVYGEQLEWLRSPALVVCLGVSLMTLGLLLFRLSHQPNAFLAPRCFAYRNLWPIMALFLISGVMLSSQTVLQSVVTGGVLHYEPYCSVRLNGAILAGVVVGCLVGRWGLTGLGWNYKQLTGLSLLLTSMYVAAMYFLVGPATPLAAFALPCFFSGVGHALLFVVLTTYVESNTPFEHRFMMLTVLGLIRTGIASPIGNALYGHLLRKEMGRNVVLLASDAGLASADALYGQALQDSVRHLYGLTVLLGVAALLILLLSRFNSKHYITLPTLRKIYSIWQKA